MSNASSSPSPSSSSPSPSPAPAHEEDAPSPHYWYPEKDPDVKPTRTSLYKNPLLPHTLLSPLPLLFLSLSLPPLLAWTETIPPLSLLYAHARASVQAFLLHHRYEDQYADHVIWVSCACVVLTLVLCISAYLRLRKVPVYLVEFATWQAPKHWQVSLDWFCERIDIAHFSPDNIDFQQKIARRSGLGNATAWPATQFSKESSANMKAGREENVAVFSGVIDEILAKTGIKPQQIDIIVVNCSLFNPTPSLASMMINKYKMRPDICSYNLGGMGCSAGVIAIDLARELLQNHPNSFALVLSMENISTNLYEGNDKNKLVQNCIFRSGGAGILLTNKTNINAKYELDCTVRVCNAADDSSYNAIFQEEDDKGCKGISLVSSRHLMPVVSDALRKNMTKLGPKVLPYSEQIKFLFTHIARSVLGKKKIAPYVPNFKKAFQHFCIHAGGKAVIDGMEKNLNLTPRDVEPSRATLYRVGNTSSSSIWYELNYIEQAFGVKKGDKIWQLAFGSGIKCNSAVWRALKNVPKMKR